MQEFLKIESGILIFYEGKTEINSKNLNKIKKAKKVYKSCIALASDVIL